MKNLTVLALFFSALLGLGTTLEAGAATRPAQEPGALSRPVPLDLEKRDGGEEDEEDLRIASSSSGMEALEEVDPGALVDMLRLRAALGR